MPLVWLSRLQGRPLPERVAGIDLMFRIFEMADRRGHRVFLLGATKEMVRRVSEIARRDYPGMILAGFHDGYFNEAEQEQVACEIRDARPDVLFVAMTSPKKELFMDRWGALMDVPVVHGVGGSFDVMAGLAARAPGWMQRLGLEWFYGMMQEPRRMWRRYLGTNLRFLCLAPFCVLCRGKNVGRDGCVSWRRDKQEPAAVGPLAGND